MVFGQILTCCRSSSRKILQKLDFKEIKFPVNIRDIQKIEKNISIDISVFGFENKEKHPIYVSKKHFEDSMLIYY